MSNGMDNKIVGLYQSGLSVKQISEDLSVSCSRVRYSLEKQSIARRDISSAIKLLQITKYGKKKFHIKTALTEKERYLKVAGIMLYWGEGTKSGNSVVFSNSDPQMVKQFLDFLRIICGVDETRLRLLLHLYSDQDEKYLKPYWSKITEIPISQFSKTYLHFKKKGTYKRVSEYGTASLRYSDKDLLNTINNWIEKYKMPP